MIKIFTTSAKRRLDNAGAALITVIAVFAVCSVLAVSVTSVVLGLNDREIKRSMKAQAYLTAKSVLTATKSYIEKNAGDMTALEGIIGKTATGEIPGMGEYTVSVEADGAELLITARGEFRGQIAELTALVDASGRAG